MHVYLSQHSRRVSEAPTQIDRILTQRLVLRALNSLTITTSLRLELKSHTSASGICMATRSHQLLHLVSPTRPRARVDSLATLPPFTVFLSHHLLLVPKLLMRRCPLQLQDFFFQPLLTVLFVSGLSKHGRAWSYTRGMMDQCGMCDGVHSAITSLAAAVTRVSAFGLKTTSPTFA
jgi:hypothetical protein